MAKTQVQILDTLYREAKRVAAEYKMSFAEVVRRSLEWTLPAYPPRTPNWTLPEPMSLGLRAQVNEDEWRLLANEPDYTPPTTRRRCA